MGTDAQALLAFAGPAAARVGARAVLSNDRVYRYHLTRYWAGDDDRGRVLFVMLNPSTADHLADDPTIRKCVGFAKRWGFGGLEVVNLFAYRSPDPRALNDVGDPVGLLNDGVIAGSAARCPKIVAAWGAGGGLNRKTLLRRADQVVYMLNPRRMECLGKTAGAGRAMPRHPLMLPYTTKLEPY